jgi:hypothetical protein
VDAAASRVQRAIREDLLAALGEHDARVGRILDDIAARTREAAQGATVRTAEQVALRAAAEVAARLEPEIAEVIRDGARTGSRVAAAQFDEVFTAAAPRPTFMSAEEAARVASQRMAGDLSVDSIGLSRRIRRAAARVSQGMTDELQASLRAQESVQRAAERLLDADDLTVRLPQYVEELREAAGAADFDEVVEAFRGRINQLRGAGGADSAFSMRSATEQLVRDLRRASADDVERIVNRWVLEKARYQARMIARTEATSAFRDAYLRDGDDKPYVMGYRWELSSGHPEPDICDVLAGQNLHGLGPGGYPKEDVPMTPHPHDMCIQTAIMDRHYFARERARTSGEAEPPREWEDGELRTGEDYLRGLDDSTRRRILGPTRDAALAQGTRVVEGNRIRRVRDITGRDTRIAPSGEQVRARPIVRADRAAGQVQPFPTLPR